MKIAYLHGLNSNNISPKNKWLHSIFETFDPMIDYKEPHIYSKLKFQISKFAPEVIVGSSMGGYFAFEMAKELNIKALLLNPALHSRSVEPDMNGLESGKFSPKIKIVLGEKDTTINPTKTVELMNLIKYENIEYAILSHAHDTPFEVFVNEILDFTEKNIV